MCYHGHWGFLTFPEVFSLALRILSPWRIFWPLSPLFHCAVLMLTLLCQIRGVVLVRVPLLCAPLPSLPHSLLGILLVSRR